MASKLQNFKASNFPNIRPTEGAGNIQLLTKDNPWQIFTLSAQKAVHLPSTGVKAGAIYRLENSTSSGFLLVVRSFDTTNISLLDQGYVEWMALIDNPTTSAHWYKVGCSAQVYTYIGIDQGLAGFPQVPTNLTHTVAENGMYHIACGIQIVPTSNVLTQNAVNLNGVQQGPTHMHMCIEGSGNDNQTIFFTRTFRATLGQTITGVTGLFSGSGSIRSDGNGRTYMIVTKMPE